MLYDGMMAAPGLFWTRILGLVYNIIDNTWKPKRNDEGNGGLTKAFEDHFWVVENMPRINFARPELSPAKLYEGLEMLFGERITKIMIEEVRLRSGMM